MSATRRPKFRPGFDKLDGRILLSASPLTPAQVRQAYAENFNFNVNVKRHSDNLASHIRFRSHYLCVSP